MRTTPKYEHKYIKWSIKIFCFTVFFLPELAKAQKPFTCEDQFFLTLSAVPPSLNEVIIDPQTGAAGFKVIDNNIIIPVNAAGYRSTDNFIYCVDPDNLRLIRIDANGTAVVLSSLNELSPNLAYFAGDVTPDGKYLVVIGTSQLAGGGGVASQIVRIDLEDPNYGVSITNTSTIAQIFDIAFHPVTDELFAYDSYSQRLMKIDLNAGSFSFPFPPTGVPVIAGSLFFDAYGNLFAYGSRNFQEEQNRLYQINPFNGVSTLLTQGPNAPSSDGCSCPYTIELSKSVEPEITFPCTEVEYTFLITNSSRRTQLGLRLEDVLPAGFSFVSVSSNPVGGVLASQPGDKTFVLNNVDLPSGQFEIKIIVNTGNVAAGMYCNQAVLRNLPASLGSVRRSDNLKTLAQDDSTKLQIVRFPLDTLDNDKVLCTGTGALRLDAGSLINTAGQTVLFSWQDGSTLPYLDVEEPGQYTSIATVGCDTIHVRFKVIESSIAVAVAQQLFTISLGDSLRLSSTATNSGNQTTFQWLDPQPGSVRCPSCPDSYAQPFNDLVYVVRVQNELGCEDTASVTIKVNKIRNIYFPNVIQPEAVEEINRYFFGFSKQPVQARRLSVYSRWGELLFEGRDIALNDPYSGWDGSFRGKQVSPGVYAWVAQIVFLDGMEETLYGDVTVIR